MILKNLDDKKIKVDMSSKAITARLQRVSQLRRLCISLGHAESVGHSDTLTTPEKNFIHENNTGELSDLSP